jgi:hypothetical protein
MARRLDATVVPDLKMHMCPIPSSPRLAEIYDVLEGGVTISRPRLR